MMFLHEFISVFHQSLRVIWALLVFMSGKGWICSSGVHLGVFFAMLIVYIVLWRELRVQKQLARTDPLTGAANYRAFSECLLSGFTRVERTCCAMTIAYIDLDNFKVINDRWGHATGDCVLKKVAQTLKCNLRRHDVVARLGGDEFAIILFDDGPDAARCALTNVLQRLSRALKQMEWRATSSMGAVIFMDAPPSLGFALKRVDARLYRVKRTGKNNLSIELWYRRSRDLLNPRIKSRNEPSLPVRSAYPLAKVS